MARLAVLSTLVAPLVLGCTVADAPSPILTGPSSLATTVLVSASPITVTQNGADRSTILVTVTGADGRPMATDLSSALEVGGVAAEFGSVTPRVARSDAATGLATFTYTAPRAGLRAAEEIVTIVITPEIGGVETAVSRRVSVRVVPPSAGPRTLAPPTASFTLAPAEPLAFAPVSFDASASRSGDAPCVGCQLEWNFGDGTIGEGVTVTHQYREAGTFKVVLTLRDSEGTVASASRSITVAAVLAPTAVFRFSPTPVGINQDVFFVANESTAVAGRRLVRYAWNFGDGSTGEGVTTTHRFDRRASFTVLLTVTDDRNASAHNTQTIQVISTGTEPTAVLTVSPTSPRAGSPVFFNAGGSVAGSAAIASYRFSYGDGSPDDAGPSVTQSHLFATAGAYVVRLTVTDVQGRTGTVTLAVTVVP